MSNELVEVLETEKVQELDLTGSGESGTILDTAEKSQTAFLQLAENIESLVKAHEKIMLNILRLAQPGDWVVHGTKASPGYAGCERIAAAIGISMTDWVGRKITWTDKLGSAYRYEFEATARFKERSLRVYGRFSTRDKLLGYKNGAWKALEDINEGNIRAAAWHITYGEGVKSLLGLHGMDPEYLKKNGINLTFAKTVEYDNAEKSADRVASGGSNGPETSKIITITKVTQKEGPLKNGKPAWIRYRIHADMGEYVTFDTKLKDAALKSINDKTQMLAVYVEDEKYGAQLKSLSEADAQEPVNA